MNHNIYIRITKGEGHYGSLAGPQDSNQYVEEADALDPRTISKYFMKWTKSLDREFETNQDRSHADLCRISRESRLEVDVVHDWFHYQRSKRKQSDQARISNTLEITGYNTPDLTMSTEPISNSNNELHAWQDYIEYNSKLQGTLNESTSDLINECNSRGDDIDSDGEMEIILKPSPSNHLLKNPIAAPDSLKRPTILDDTWNSTETQASQRLRKRRRHRKGEGENTAQAHATRVDIRRYFCLICPYSYDTAKTWRDHQERTHFPRTIYLCGRSLDGIPCELRPSYRKDNFKNHLEHVHNVPDGPERKAEISRRSVKVRGLFHDKCGFCAKDLPTWEESFNHILGHIKSGHKQRDDWDHRCCDPNHTLTLDVHYNSPPNETWIGYDHPGGDSRKDDDFDSNGNQGGSSGSGSRPSANEPFNSSSPHSDHPRDGGSTFDASITSGKTHRWLTCTPSSFELVRKLGSGGFGEVEEVSYGSPGKTLARKTVYRGRFNSDSGAEVRAFKNEVDVLKALQHPHIVEFAGSYIFRDRFQILMYPAAEGNLAQFMEGPEGIFTIDRLGEKERILHRSMSCLSSAINYLHSRSVVHFDIKPRNILVSHHKFFLTDFGISKKITDDPVSTKAPAMTTRYAPPETVRESAQSQIFNKRSSDIFSFACVLIEILTWTILGGHALKDFTAFRSKASKDKPFRETIRETKEWMRMLEKTWKSRKSALSPTIPFDIIQKMMSQYHEDRPTAHEVWLRFPRYSCCSSSQEQINCSEAFSRCVTRPPKSAQEIQKFNQGWTGVHGAVTSPKLMETSPYLGTCNKDYSPSQASLSSIPKELFPQLERAQADCRDSLVKPSNHSSRGLVEKEVSIIVEN